MSSENCAKEAPIIPLRAAKRDSAVVSISPASSIRSAVHSTTISATLKEKMMNAMNAARGAAARIAIFRNSVRL